MHGAMLTSAHTKNDHPKQEGTTMSQMQTEARIGEEFGFDMEANYNDLDPMGKLIYQTISKLAATEMSLANDAEHLAAKTARIAAAIARGGYEPNTLGELQGSATMFDAKCAEVGTLRSMLRNMTRLAATSTPAAVDRRPMTDRV